MAPEINYLAVLAAAFSSMVVGSLWYGPLFGKKWIALMGWSDEEVNKGKSQTGQMKKAYSLMFVGSLVMAYVLAHAIVFASEYLLVFGFSAGLMAGFWNWLGFVAPVTLGPVLWEGKSWKLWLLNNGYNLLSLMVMGVILALWV